MSERVEVSRERRTIENADGVGYEDVVNYRDGHVATGEYTNGPSRGHKWLRGEGGALTNPPATISVAGLHNVPVADFRPGQWGTVLEQGQNPKKPKTGETWLWCHASTTEAFTQLHPDEALVLREGVDREDDAQGRPVYEVRTGSGGKVMVVLTAYADDGEYRISTGKHVAGPKEGEVWEERRSLVPANEQPIPSIMETDHGTLQGLVIRGFSRTIVRSKQDAGKGGVADPAKLHLIIRGEWVGATQ